MGKRGTSLGVSGGNPLHTWREGMMEVRFPDVCFSCTQTKSYDIEIEDMRLLM